MTDGAAAAAAPSWEALYIKVSQQLDDSGLELLGGDSGNEARLLLKQVSGFEQAELLSQWREPASPRHLAQLDELLASRLRGRPIQYVLGSWGFRALDLFVDERVLIPRPETELVVEAAAQELDRMRRQLTASGEPRRFQVADLGCGSGAIGLAISAEHTDVEVYCCDISEPALAVTRANLAGLGMAASPVRALQGSWYEALAQAPELAAAPNEPPLDLICSNPPYIAAASELPPSVSNFEPHQALFAGAAGTESLAEVITGAPDWLRSGGALICELDPSQAGFATDLAQQCGLEDVAVLPDLAGRDRVLLARKPS